MFESSISEMAYGQWGNLAGYIYGTAVYYTLNPIDNRTPEEIHKKAKEEEDIKTDTIEEESTETDDDDEGIKSENDKQVIYLKCFVRWHLIG